MSLCKPLVLAVALCVNTSAFATCDEIAYHLQMSYKGGAVQMVTQESTLEDVTARLANKGVENPVLHAKKALRTLEALKQTPLSSREALERVSGEPLNATQVSAVKVACMGFSASGDIARSLRDETYPVKWNRKAAVPVTCPTPKKGKAHATEPCAPLSLWRVGSLPLS